MTWYEQAKDKLAEGAKAKLDRYGECMKREVCTALTDFAGQDEEFAQAIVQGGDFQDCMKAVAKCVHGSYISDTEAYGAAVKFYFPGAELKVEMRIDLAGSAGEDADRRAETEESSSAVIIDLSDYF